MEAKDLMIGDCVLFKVKYAGSEYNVLEIKKCWRNILWDRR